MTSNKKDPDIPTEPGNGIKDIREEKKINIAERNQLTKIIQEINKLKKEIEQIDNKEVSLPKYNININNDKSMINNTLNGINNNDIIINRTVAQYEDENIINNDDICNDYMNNKNEEDLSEHKNKIENLMKNPNSIILERIDFYKNRCLNIIGKKVFTKAYECLKNSELLVSEKL